MSIAEVRAEQERLREFIAVPRAFVLSANPAWGSAEMMNRIALEQEGLAAPGEARRG